MSDPLDEILKKLLDKRSDESLSHFEKAEEHIRNLGPEDRDNALFRVLVEELERRNGK